MLSLQVPRNRVGDYRVHRGFVDLVDSRLRLPINHHEEEARFITRCSALYCGGCVRQVTSKGGGK
jgi:hypothetical protein